MMMSDIHGEPVSVATVTHVLSIVDKGYTHEETITMDEVIHAVALWQCLQKVQDSIEAHFADYDTDNTDSLDASQVRHMLTDLNDGHLVSLGEVDWVIESADDGDGKLTRDEARSAIALWYMRSISAQNSSGIMSAALEPLGSRMFLSLLPKSCRG